MEVKNLSKAESQVDIILTNDKIRVYQFVLPNFNDRLSTCQSLIEHLRTNLKSTLSTWPKSAFDSCKFDRSRLKNNEPVETTYMKQNTTHYNS